MGQMISGSLQRRGEETFPGTGPQKVFKNKLLGRKSYMIMGLLLH